jgi:hypothetical protein
MTSGMRPGGSRTPVNRRGLAVVAIIAGLLVVGVIASATGAGKHVKPGQASASNQPTLAASQSPSPSRAKSPTFAFPGDRHCAITYRARGSSAMTWTATVTVAGQLITHASDKSGNIYRRVVHIIPGPKVLSAPVPLSQINDIGGVLNTAGTSYGCSVAPYRPGHRVLRRRRPRARHIRTPRPAPVQSPTPVAQSSTAASCYPLSDEGTCYEPGEFCRDSDHGATGLAGDGETIMCEDNDGWRWEPA